MLKIVYAHEKWDENKPCIFLAGPSPRSADHHDWRPDAVKIFENLRFDGAVFIPLPRDGKWLKDYDAQVEWELKYLDRASSIVFWIPRDKDNLPAFTTNVEFGMFLKSGKIVLGYPPSAIKMRYLQYIAEMEGVPTTSKLEDTIKNAITLALS